MGLHKNVAENNLHEPKGMSLLGAGAADVGKLVVSKGDGTTETRKIFLNELDSGAALAGQIGVSDGAGAVTAQTPTRMGMWDYNDVTTTGTPIPLTVAGTKYALTNDGAGVNTNLTFALPELSNIWVTGTNRFDYTMLELGDTVDIRVDVEVTTSGVNDEIALFWRFGEGAAPYDLQIVRQNFKVAGTYTFTVLHSAYMGDVNTRDNPGVLLMSSDSTGDTVVVNGWFVRTITRSDF